MDKRIEEETRNVTVIVPDNAANAEVPTETVGTVAAARKAAFEKVMDKVFTDHDGLFRKLAQ